MEQLAHEILSASRKAFEITRKNFDATFDDAILSIMDGYAAGHVPFVSDALSEIIEGAILYENSAMGALGESTRCEFQRASAALNVLKAFSESGWTDELEEIFRHAVVYRMVSDAKERAERLSVLAASLGCLVD